MDATTSESTDATSPPDWFNHAIGGAFTGERQTVDGALINILRWAGPSSDAPGLILIHGGGAHARWWQFVAPWLTDKYHVAAFDLSGMGDSEHRDHYSIEQWAREAEAVRAHCRFSETIIVGHSLGGFITMCYAAERGERGRVD
ncbi:MAG: alpha/beta hydrolase [Pseudomonadota bacterium]